MNRMSRKTTLLAAALTAAAQLALAGCGMPAAGPAAGTGTAASGAGPAVPALAWQPCDGGFRCAIARVPLNYRDPRGATINIAVISHFATSPGRSLGWLFLNFGGPTTQVGSLVRAYSSLPAAWQQRYNLITFDPRGMGYSTQISCLSTQAADKLLGGLPVFPVGAAQQTAWDRAYAQLGARCAADAGPLLDHDSTADMARDMDLLRQAVGDPVLNYYGASYGTLLGATYANLFPATTGRMIFDGNIDPVAWSAGNSQLPAQVRMGTPQASAATMTAFLDLCGQASTAACAFSAGTPAATTAKWNTLLRLASKHPVNLGGQQGTYTYAAVIASVDLSAVAQWQSSAQLLQQLWIASTAQQPASSAASSSAPLAASSAAPLAASSSAPFSGPEPMRTEVQNLAVLCADSPNPRDPAAYAAAAATGTFAAESAYETEGCADWPAAAAQDRYTGPWNRPTASTILLLAITGDPELPYEDSLAMSRDLARTRLLTIDGYGHTLTNNDTVNTCAVNDLVQYTLTGALPAPGTVCQENGTPFPAP
jgi:pimeloyl-ACP methyl ester carboxylesterase